MTLREENLQNRLQMIHHSTSVRKTEPQYPHFITLVLFEVYDRVIVSAVFTKTHETVIAVIARTNMISTSDDTFLVTIHETSAFVFG